MLPVGLASSRSAARLAVALAIVVSTRALPAQVPGVAVLQNAFTSRGLAFAGNFGSSSGQSFFGAAAGWGLGERFLVSGAAGLQRSRSANRGAYGARATMGVWSSRGGSLGAAAFAGIGGAPRTTLNDEINNPAITSLPLGVSMGYRRGMGSRGSISGYVSPFYSWSRIDSGTVVSSSGFRTSVGVDVGFSQSLGATIGAEFGAGRGGASRSGVLGAAVTFVPGRR